MDYVTCDPTARSRRPSLCCDCTRQHTGLQNKQVVKPRTNKFCQQLSISLDTTSTKFKCINKPSTATALATKYISTKQRLQGNYLLYTRYCTAGVDKQVSSTSLYHCRQCNIVHKPRSDHRLRRRLLYNAQLQTKVPV